MRLSSLFLAGLLALAAGCGGRTNAYIGSVGEGGASSGGSSGGGGSSGAGSSGFGSASSSGFGSSSSSSSGFGSSSGSSSGGVGGTSSSSGSGGSSGGSGCDPLPGCSSSFECPEPSGCGTCFCDGSGWQCDDDLDAGLSCPSEPPVPGSFCSTCQEEAGCGYGGLGGEPACGVSCNCVDNAWQCFAPPCAPPPICPPLPPPTGSPCFIGVGSTCFYDLDGSCSDADECVCDPSGTFSCFDPYVCPGDGGGLDTGPPDTGPPIDDSGSIDAGSGLCPEQQPVSGSPCADDGFVCTYFPTCETNCLCADNAWVCATQGGPCAMGHDD